jgi:hypothetical protein
MLTRCVELGQTSYDFENWLSDARMGYYSLVVGGMTKFFKVEEELIMTLKASLRMLGTLKM